eukprot:Skav227590  [mRNA]  locus=scaffold1141:163806:168364:+ [translate_table: standard]
MVALCTAGFPVDHSGMVDSIDGLSPEERLQGCDDASKELCKLLEDSTPGIERWIRSMETAMLTIQDLASKVVDPRHVDTMTEAAKALRKQFGKLDEGPAEVQELAFKFRAGKGKSIKVLGYSSFIQDMSLLDSWPLLISFESKNMKLAMAAGPGSGPESIDKWKLHEAADGAANKINKLLAKVRLQMDEYTSFAEVMSSPEALMALIQDFRIST